MDRIIDRPDMTSAVDRGRKALTQQHYSNDKPFLVECAIRFIPI